MQIKSFTLREILIVILIVWVFFSIVTRTYLSIMDITTKVRNESVVQQNYHDIETYINALLANNSLDSQKYAQKTDWYNDIYDKLYLSDGETSTILYQTWDCVPFSWNLSDFTLEWWSQNEACWLEMERNWSTSQLTDPQEVWVANMAFRIFPSTFTSWDVNSLNKQEQWTQAMQMFWFIYSYNIWYDWSDNIWYPISSFYDITEK